MTARFFDLQDLDNALNGCVVDNLGAFRTILESARGRRPFFAELIGDSGFKILLGLGGTEGCVQFSSENGSPPYLMAVDQNTNDPEGEMSFLIGDTPTPVSKRFSLPHRTIMDVVESFLTTGQRANIVLWEEI